LLLFLYYYEINILFALKKECLHILNSFFKPYINTYTFSNLVMQIVISIPSSSKKFVILIKRKLLWIFILKTHNKTLKLLLNTY